MATQQEIDIVRQMAGNTRTRNLTDARIGQVIDDNWKRAQEQTGISVDDLQASYYNLATQIVRRYSVAELFIGIPEMVDTRNSLLREAQTMIQTLTVPSPSDPDAEIICDASDYETYPLNPVGTIWLGSQSGRPRTTWGSDFIVV